MNHVNTSYDDFFVWDNENVSSIFWDTATSPAAYDFYYWGGITLFILIFLWPFLGTFFGAMVGYLLGLILAIYRIKHHKNSQYTLLDVTEQKKITCKLWKLVSSVWHNHEIIGWENVPESATVFIMYHGPFGIDIMYFLTKLSTYAGERQCYLTTHRQQVEIRGWRTWHRVMNCQPYSQEQCIEFLDDDSYLVVTPGGMPESRFSNNKYRVFFDGRKGFADVILNTKEKVTVIPVFTRNIQEAFWVPWFVQPIVSGRCAPKRILFSPMAGGIPVKLTTFLGPPVEYDKTYTRDQLSDKIIESLQDHIDKHQRVPGNRFYAMTERFCGQSTKKASGNRQNSTIV